MMGHPATVLFALATMASAGDTEVASFSHNQLSVGQRFEIQTADSVLRGQLLNRATGECEMSISAGGEKFSPKRTVYLLGATAGPQPQQMLVRMHEVKVGLKMELGMNDLEQHNRLLTSEVKSIRLAQ